MLMEESTETDHLIPDSKVYLKVKTEKIKVYDREGNVNYSKGVVSELEEKKKSGYLDRSHASGMVSLYSVHVLSSV